jgi:hypothetical protein
MKKPEKRLPFAHDPIWAFTKYCLERVTYKDFVILQNLGRMPNGTIFLIKDFEAEIGLPKGTVSCTLMNLRKHHLADTCQYHTVTKLISCARAKDFQQWLQDNQVEVSHAS